MRRRSSKLLQKLWKLPRGPEIWSHYFQSFLTISNSVQHRKIRASYAVPQVALNSRGSPDVGWDMTDHRKRGAPSGSVNFVFVSCGTAVHLERHQKMLLCCCCLHIKSRSGLYSVLSNIRTGPTDANAFRGHRLTTQKGYTYQKEIKGPRYVTFFVVQYISLLFKEKSECI